MSSKQVKEGWGCTCPECPWVPPRGEDDYVQTMRYSSRTGNRTYANIKYPVRCRSCATKQKRYQRMRRRLNKIWECSYTFFNSGCELHRLECQCSNCSIYAKPKLITFALPSTISENYEEKNYQVDLLKKKMKKCLKILRSNGVLGGTFVIECTSRLVEPEYGLMNWKHHAHVHMVAIAPKVPRAALSEFCEQLLPLGLGRINYKAPRGKGARRKVASYISKYITKNKVHSRTFGVMRGNPKRLI